MQQQQQQQPREQGSESLRPRGGARFSKHTGLAAPYMYDNVSTDVPAPPVSESLKAKGITGPAASAFANIRYKADGTENPDFVFNQEAYRRASIMIVGRNYGTGSSRATGVSLPLAAWGVKVYIGESFGPIFITNAVQYGVLTIALPRPTVDRIAAWVRKNSQNRDITKSQITVDLDKQTIELPGEQPIPFEYNPRYRNKLLNGLDDFAEIQPHLAKAQAKRQQDEAERPWLYQQGKR
jgi:3-isopropylmalate/(R)-2-methylmalate dehydratase small subunit